MKPVTLGIRHYKYTDIMKNLEPRANEPEADTINDYSTRFLFESEMGYYRKMRILAINEEFQRIKLDDQKEVNPLLNYYRPRAKAPLRMSNKGRSIMRSNQKILYWNYGANKIEMDIY